MTRDFRDTRGVDPRRPSRPNVTKTPSTLVRCGLFVSRIDPHWLVVPVGVPVRVTVGCVPSLRCRHVRVRFVFVAVDW